MTAKGDPSQSENRRGTCSNDAQAASTRPDGRQRSVQTPWTTPAASRMVAETRDGNMVKTLLMEVFRSSAQIDGRVRPWRKDSSRGRKRRNNSGHSLFLQCR